MQATLGFTCETVFDASRFLSVHPGVVVRGSECPRRSWFGGADAEQRRAVFVVSRIVGIHAAEQVNRTNGDQVTRSCVEVVMPRRAGTSCRGCDAEAGERGHEDPGACHTTRPPRDAYGVQFGATSSRNGHVRITIGRISVTDSAEGLRQRRVPGNHPGLREVDTRRPRRRKEQRPMCGPGPKPRRLIAIL